MEQAKYKSFLVKFAYWAAIILIAALFIKYLLGPLTPFLIALAIALPMQALARKITKKLKINKKFLTVLLVILCYVLIAGLLVLAVFGVVHFFNFINSLSVCKIKSCFFKFRSSIREIIFDNKILTFFCIYKRCNISIF